ARIANRVLFRPFPFEFNKALAARARSSNLILRTMYLGARIAQALLNHTNQHDYMVWIDIFHSQISDTQSTTIEAHAAHLGDRLSAHQGLSFFAFMLSNNPAGYSLLRRGVPIFLQLAAKTPQVWSQGSAISISHALNPKRHEMTMFVLMDVILALAFGTAPLLNYDTTIHESEFGRGTYNFLEQVYSCPVILLILLARINSARIARLTNQRSPNPRDILEVEDCVRSWSPTLDYAETPPESIARLAIQESWRLATLIYAYMGMCGVDSADERVQPLVSQMAQLTNTIEHRSPWYLRGLRCDTRPTRFPTDLQGAVSPVNNASTRKKKCDEKKPECDRCLSGGFDCLGYAHLGATSASTSKHGDNQAMQNLETSSPSLTRDSSITNSPPTLGFSQSSDQPPWSTVPSSGAFSSPFSVVENTSIWRPEQYNLVVAAPFYEPKSIPMNPELDPFDLDNMKNLIVTQYTRLAHRISFRPLPYSVELGLTNYLIRGSHLICKTLYLGARISQALLDDTNWQGYIGWIDTFHNRILGTHSALIEVNISHLADRLAANCNLAVYAFMILNSSIGYTIFRKGAPIFLQLAAKFPDMWKGDSAISISQALHSPRHELAKFAVMDTVAALAFGIAPLIHYDTAIREEDHNPGRYQFLEPVYACPVIVLITLARVNVSRASQLMGRDTTTPEGIEEYEAAVRNWKPRVDYDDQPSQLITRLAVQEAWRQAALIYLYMGMCGANSSDSRVEPLVRQVAQLASTVEPGGPFVTHLFIPCLIAGVAARKEKHRGILRKKILVSQKADACLLRGADFSFVLDHLWHGAAARGNPVTWDDYINSRCLTIPIPIEA
ncbi:hypothetical protein FRC11_009544, partial [Ceratobasidium sp. 423]